MVYGQPFVSRGIESFRVSEPSRGQIALVLGLLTPDQEDWILSMQPRLDEQATPPAAMDVSPYIEAMPEEWLEETDEVVLPATRIWFGSQRETTGGGTWGKLNELGIALHRALKARQPNL